MYDQTARASSYRKGHRFSTPQVGRRTQKNPVQRIRLLQLLICLILFLATFIGKGIFPGKMLQVRDEILSVISSDTDFYEAFSNLGSSLSTDETILDKLGDFCVEVFGSNEPAASPVAADKSPELVNLLKTESQFLSANSDPQALSDHFFAQSNSPFQLKLKTDKIEQPEVEVVAEPQPIAVPALGVVVQNSTYSGQALPNNYTMDHLSLGEMETITPVLGHVNSVYGYRDHPINGEYQFHSGIDIGGQSGDPIKAFAAGTVEYVGKDASYGLYLQIDHGNNVKSFYAHCKTITVSKGQQVAIGEKIAEVGSSGSATGPHLHLELKYGQTHLNPVYYIDYLSRQ